MRYTVRRPSDGEALAHCDNLIDASLYALDYAVTDEQSITVERETGTIVRVAHPSGSIYKTVGTPGGRLPIATDDDDDETEPDFPYQTSEVAEDDVEPWEQGDTRAFPVDMTDATPFPDDAR